MKVLLCSPYLDIPGISRGGINIWANNILKYYSQVNTSIRIIPVSFDRHNYVSVDTNILKRILSGLKDYSRSIGKAIKQISTKQYDIIHICTSASLSLSKDLLLVYAAHKYGAKAVVHFHFGRIPELAEKNNWEWKLLKLVVSNADVAVTMDLRSSEILKKHGMNNVQNLPNPLSLSIINQINQKKQFIEPTPNKLLFVGHVLISKGIFELLRACSMIPEIKLMVVGKIEHDVKITIDNEYKNASWLNIVGEIPHEQVITEMLSTGVFVLPTYTEGFPNVILESMACGCPIVTTPVGAIPEMLDTNGENDCGICVMPKDASALKEAIEKMLTNREYALSCGLNAQRRVNEMFTIPKVWDMLMQTWEKACL